MVVLKHRYVCMAICTFLAMAAQSHGINLISNGSFEITAPGTIVGSVNRLAPGSTAITGWEVFDASIDLVQFTTWDASDGDWSIDLDGNVFDAGGVRQTIATVAGKSYEVRFDLSGNPALALPTVKTMRVSADGQSADFGFDITGITPTAMGWKELTFTFIADDSSATIAFESTADEFTGVVPGWGAAIDNVRAEQVITDPPNPPGVPEPLSGSMLLLATGAIAVSIRRRRADAGTSIS